MSCSRTATLVTQTLGVSRSILKGTEISDWARDQVFFRVRATCSASGATMGDPDCPRGEHLFREHCRATPAPMSHLRIAGGIHQLSMGTVPGVRTSRTEPEGRPLVRVTIGISAPFQGVALPCGHRELG